jgi:2-keto-4-pentenoate hydratase
MSNHERTRPRREPLGDRGRPVYGPTPPGGAVPCRRESPLSSIEVDEIVELIARGRIQRHSVRLPERLLTRDWNSILQVIVQLDARLARSHVGWKIGGASEDVRRAESCPSPAPGRLYAGTVFESPALLPRELFINYRNCESEFAFRLSADLPARDDPYSEAEVAESVDCLLPAIEVGDMVFDDWYGASSFFGPCMDNCGGAALVYGTANRDWRSLDLANAEVSILVNGQCLKSGLGSAAMGHPLMSLTWMANWLRERGRGLEAGELISTGTCTGHCFVASCDTVIADFGPLGFVEARFE